MDLGNSSDTCGFVKENDLFFRSETKKPRPGRERGLPLERKQNYRRPLLEALSGLILAFVEVVAALT